MEYQMQERYNNFAHSYLVGDQLSSLAIQVHSELGEKFLEDLFITDELGSLKGEIDTYNALKSRNSNGNIAELTLISDRNRRMLLTKIKRRLKDDIDMAEFFPAEAAKAEAVMEVINRNPVNHEVSYEEESVQLNRLFAEMAIASVVESSSVSGLYAKLLEEQVQFEELRNREAEESAQAVTGEVKQPLSQIVYRLEGLFSYIERKAISQNDLYEPSAQRIEQMVSEVMSVARARETRKENIAL